MTRSEILRRLNKLSPWDELLPTGVLQQDEIKMPIELLLQGILGQVRDTKPGVNCKVTSYVVTDDGITLKFLRGDFERERLAPQKAIDLFSDGAAGDFNEE